MEVEKSELENKPSVDARSCYPNRQTMFRQFESRLDKGLMQLVPVDKEETTVTIFTWGFEERYPNIDFSKLVPGKDYSYEEVTDLLAPDQREVFITGEEAKLRRDCFQVDIAQRARAWWLSSIEDKDAYSWLDSSRLYSINSIEIGDNRFIINDFSGRVDIKEITGGITIIAKMLESKGLNIGSLLSVLNILPENNSGFSVPPEYLKKDPTLFVAANANKQRQILNFNERSFIGRQFREKDKGFILANGWGPTFIHELGHFLNMGLSDIQDRSFAEQIGWQTKADVTTSEYGELQDVDTKRSKGWGSYVTNDYGEEIYIPENKMAKHLQQGHKDAGDKTIQPPSEYAQSDDAEDIAESFTAYFFAPEKLDAVRKSMVERLLASISNENTQHNVKLQQIDLKVFDPWEQILPSEIKYTKRVYRLNMTN